VAILRATLLGRFAVVSASGSLSIQMSLARLHAYLALSNGEMLPRSKVAGTLWPDLSEGRARANLSTVTWRLRTAILRSGGPATALDTRHDSIGLRASVCEVDVDVFRRESLAPGAFPYSLDRLARAAKAVEVYKGDLLEDWDEEWCFLEREQLRHRCIATLRALCSGFERLHRSDLALRFARQAAAMDPLNEVAQRSLMRLLANNGDRASAVVQFNRFAALASSELAVEPGTETIALVARIKSSRKTIASGVVEEAFEPLNVAEKVPLVGRAGERQKLGAFLDAALAGGGGGLLMVGDAGIGKTRLGEWAAEEWAARGGIVAVGRCIEFNAPVPYQPILDSLDSALEFQGVTRVGGEQKAGPLTSALPLAMTVSQEVNDRGQSRPAGKLRMFSQIRTRLAEASRQTPLLLVIEDLQWADSGSVDLLAFLLGRTAALRLAILLTSRPGVTSAQRANVEMLSRVCATTMALAPLDGPDTCELVLSLLSFDDVPRSFLQWLQEETEGNPLFIIETLRLLQQQGATYRDTHDLVQKLDRDARPGGGSSIPSGIRSAIQQRLRLIATGSLRIASIASVLGRSFDEELLAMIVGVNPNRLSRAVSDLLRAGVLGREASGYRFTHDKIRAICYEDLSVRTRQIYHARAASALVQIPGTPLQQLAWHQFCAAQWSLAASSWSEAAGHARMVYAYDDALRAYRQAVYCVRRDGTQREPAKIVAEIELLLELEDVLAVLGRPRERRAILARIGRLSQRTGGAFGQSTWFARQSRLEEHVGSFRLAATLARRAWAVARSAGERTNQAESLRILAWALNRMGKYRRSLAISRLALRKLSPEASPVVVTTLWQAAASCIWLGDHGAASSFLGRARVISAELGLPSEDPLILSTQAVLDKWSGNTRSSRVGLLKALKFGEEASDPRIIARAVGSLAMLDALEGKLGDAILRLRRAILTIRSTAQARLEVSCLNEVANGVGRLLGNYRWAWNASNHALRLSRSSASKIMIAMCRDTQAQLLIEESHLDEAKAATEEALRSLAAEGCYATYPDPLARSGAVCLLLGDVPEAISALEAARDICIRTGERLQLVDTLTFLALAYARQGEADRALATSEEAIRLLTEIHCANLQPQRIFWHHFLILEQFNREPRVDYLRRAVALIDERGATLSRAQRRRFRQDVALNRDILDAWERCQGTEGHQAAPTELAAIPESVAAAPAATAGALSAVPGS